MVGSSDYLNCRVEIEASNAEHDADRLGILPSKNIRIPPHAHQYRLCTPVHNSPSDVNLWKRRGSLSASLLGHFSIVSLSFTDLTSLLGSPDLKDHV